MNREELLRLPERVREEIVYILLVWNKIENLAMRKKAVEHLARLAAECERNKEK